MNERTSRVFSKELLERNLTCERKAECHLAAFLEESDYIRYSRGRRSSEAKSVLELERYSQYIPASFALGLGSRVCAVGTLDNAEILLARFALQGRNCR